MRRLISRYFADIALVILVGALFLTVFGRLPSHQVYFYDEADYINAARMGMAANILERPSMPVSEFLATGLNPNRQTRRDNLSDLVRGSKDITFYRHYHGPLYYYMLALLGPAVHFDEYAMRYSGLVIHVLGFAAIYFLVLPLASSRMAALIAGFLFLFGQANLGTDTQITPHIAYTFFAILTLLLFARYLQTGLAAWLYTSAAACAAAFCSIDYAILLPVTFAACFSLFPSRRPAWVLLGKSALLFLGTLAAIWPSGLLKLSAIKGYFFIAYLSLLRAGSYGDGSPLGVWLRRISGSPAEYALLALGLCAFLFFLVRRRLPAYLVPFVIYAALMLLTTLKNTSMNPTYVSSILPPLAVVAGVTIAMFLVRAPAALRFIAASALLAVIAVSGYSVLRPGESLASERPEAGIMSAIRASHLEGSTILVPYEYLPAISYYLPESQLHPYRAAESPFTLAARLRDYRAQAIVAAGPGLEDVLARSLRVHSQPITAAPGYNLVHIDGTI